MRYGIRSEDSESAKAGGETSSAKPAILSLMFGSTSIAMLDGLERPNHSRLIRRDRATTSTDVGGVTQNA